MYLYDIVFSFFKIFFAIKYVALSKKLTKKDLNEKGEIYNENEKVN